MSIPPHERINIEYVHDDNGQKKSIELPLRLLMLGDYTGRQVYRAVETKAPNGEKIIEQQVVPVQDRQVVNVTKANFDQVLRDQNVEVEFDAPNRVSGKGALHVKLSFDSLEAFEPDSIVKNVPKLRDLLEVRNALEALIGPVENKAPLRALLDRISSDPTLREALRRELAAAEPKNPE